MGIFPTSQKHPFDENPTTRSDSSTSKVLIHLIPNFLVLYINFPPPLSGSGGKYCVGSPNS